MLSDCSLNPCNGVFTGEGQEAFKDTPFRIVSHTGDTIIWPSLCRVHVLQMTFNLQQNARPPLSCFNNAAIIAAHSSM